MAEKDGISSRLVVRRRTQKIIIIYLIIIIIASFVLSVYLSGLPVSENLIKMNSILISVLGASIYYVRKMYKCGIRKEFIEPEMNEIFSQAERGAVLYYMLRPLIAAVFGYILFVAIRTQIAFVCSGQLNDLGNFANFVLLSSFVMGYSIGDFIDKFELFGKKRVGQLVKYCTVSPENTLEGKK